MHTISSFSLEISNRLRSTCRWKFVTLESAMFGAEFWVAGKSSATPSSSWSRPQDKLFEQALVVFPEETPDRWARIAELVQGKSPLEVRQHYEDLVHDVREIDSGRVELPSYSDDFPGEPGWAAEYGASLASSSRARQAETERKKGVPWTEEEHRLFLIGLQKYGKGDWRSISRNAVVTRTPTQVASHAQKYYLRLNSVKKEKKRSSIHDITTVEDKSLAQSSYQSMPGQFGPAEPNMSMMGLPSHFYDGQGSSGYQQLGFPM